MKPKNITIVIDTIFCLLLLPAMVYLLPVDKWLKSDPMFVVVLMVWLYAVYYIHRYLTVPQLFGERKNLTIAPLLLLLATLLVTYLIASYQLEQPSRIMRIMMEERPRGGGGGGGMMPRQVPPMRVQGVWFFYLIVTSFSAVVALLSQLNKETLARQSVEFERKKAELALYKAQINPHFLFNTLNTLLGMVISKSEQTEEAFMQFSDLMKYMCANSTRDKVAVGVEIDYIGQYIELQRYRLNEHTKVNFTHDVDAVSRCAEIAPMLLITFVENAIKYGASPHSDTSIDITIGVKDNLLTMFTHNMVQPTGVTSSGIGIANCRKRLDLIYPKRHTLIINNLSGEYNVSLTIKLD